jgi:NADH-quinone oxidoreductase subunit C
LLAAIDAALPNAGLEAGTATDRPTLIVPAARLEDLCRVLRDEPALSFDVLVEVTAVDLWPAEPRFEVVYHLVSTERQQLLRLKVRLANDEARLPTLIGVWSSANWLEREVWDLFGIVFDGHGDLRRLMMPEDWEGHPLRRDYPVQIKMTPKVHAPLQMTAEEFAAKIEGDRTVRGGSGSDQGR